MPIIPGLPVMFYSRGNALDASIKKLNALLDKNGAIVKSRPKVSYTVHWNSNFLKFQFLDVENWWFRCDWYCSQEWY